MEKYRIIPKEKTIAYRNPELVKIWHPTKNGKLTPFDVTCSSKINAWWICNKCSLEWKNLIAYRTAFPAALPSNG
jgi:hypothetical protein